MQVVYVPLIGSRASAIKVAYAPRMTTGGWVFGGVLFVWGFAIGYAVHAIRSK